MVTSERLSKLAGYFILLCFVVIVLCFSVGVHIYLAAQMFGGWRKGTALYAGVATGSLCLVAILTWASKKVGW